MEIYVTLGQGAAKFISEWYQDRHLKNITLLSLLFSQKCSSYEY
jgi:hypothetical protein